MTRPRALLPLLGALLLAGAAACPAQTRFTVTLNTAPLIGSAGGPFALDFQMTDGSGTNDGNNTATLTGFRFGGGAASGTPTASGGATGSLTSGITLTDSGFVNELFQGVTPGSALSFDVSVTGNADAGPTPDQFSFAVLDGTGAEIPTASPSGALLTVDFLPGTRVIRPFGATGAYAAVGAPAITLGAPPPAVPEPSSVVLLGAGLAVGARRVRRRPAR